jgi:hypothetical protein
LAWPEVYKAQLIRVLKSELAEAVWEGGEQITPFTDVDVRAAWVGKSLQRLKNHTNREEQFDILSRVALVRPIEEVNMYKKIFNQHEDINQLIEVQHTTLKNSPNGGFIDPWWYKDGVLHLSKVAADRQAYDQAKTASEIRRAYCFCSLIREAKDPQVDPIFCFRAAGWARQFWEPILDVKIKDCRITESILKGDRFCAWDFYLPTEQIKNR